ncbi:MAG: DUF58 domain-containing protein [Candidatus Riflebacteria bacterium]|nr:DUF58 domain-containing protein [Candidatus Riflebacteria bacterium]
MLPKELLKEIKRIEIKTRCLVDSVYSGGYRSVFKGQGIEFSGIREYSRGDEFRSIDWKVTARTGNLHIREHVEERELQVVIALDLSGSMSFGSGSREKRETAVEFAAAIGMSAAENHDRFGILMFTDHVEKYSAPAKGKTHLLRLIRDLLYFVPKEKNTDFKPVFHLLNNSLRHKSVIFLVSDFLDCQNFEREMKITAARHDLIAVKIRDRREIELPDVGLIELEDPETGEESLLDTSNRQRVSELSDLIRRMDTKFRSFAEKIGVDFVELTAGESVSKPIIALFNRRTRRFSSSG